MSTFVYGLSIFAPISIVIGIILLIASIVVIVLNKSNIPLYSWILLVLGIWFVIIGIIIIFIVPYIGDHPETGNLKVLEYDKPIRSIHEF